MLYFVLLDLNSEQLRGMVFAAPAVLFLKRLYGRRMRHILGDVGGGIGAIGDIGGGFGGSPVAVGSHRWNAGQGNIF
jgi:hypothetical protein